MLRVLLLLSFVSTTAFCEWKDLKRELRSLMRSKNPYSIQKKLEECSKYDEKEVAEYLIDIIKSRRNPVTYKMTSCRVLSGFKNEEVRKLLAKETLSSSSGVHISQALMAQQDAHCLKVCEDIVMRSNDSHKLTAWYR